MRGRIFGFWSADGFLHAPLGKSDRFWAADPSSVEHQSGVAAISRPSSEIASSALFDRFRESRGPGSDLASTAKQVVTRKRQGRENMAEESAHQYHIGTKTYPSGNYSYKELEKLKVFRVSNNQTRKPISPRAFLFCFFWLASIVIAILVKGL